MAVLLMALAAVWYVRQESDADAYAYASRGEVLAQQGRLAEARGAYIRAISLRDDVAEFHLRLGRVNFQLGDLGGAFTAYDFARSLAPDNLEAQLAVAQLGLQVGEFQKSKEATRELLLANPTFVEARVVRGVSLMIDRKFDDAIEAADEILQDNPRHEQAVMLKIRATLNAGHPEEARDLVERYAAEFPSSAPIATTRLEVYRQLSDAEGMIETFDELRTLVPDSADLRLDEAAVYFRLGQDERAIGIAAEALSLPDIGPQGISAVVRLLRLYAETGQLLQALPRIAQSDNDDARLEFAQLLVTRDQTENALQLIDGLDGPQAQVVRALALLKSGNSARARKIASRIVEEDASNCLARYVRSSVDLAQDRPREAVYEAQYAVNECPTLIEAWKSLAASYDELERTEQTARVYRQAIDLNPQEPELVRAYSDWLLEKGRSREALAAWRSLTRTMPAHIPAWQSYLELCRSADPSCVEDATQGLAEARDLLGLDPPPGERATAGLFGRFLIR